MTRTIYSLIIVLLAGLLAVSPAAAQSNTPLILLSHGSFWAWDETTNVLRPLTPDGSHFTPVLSPDGRRIAYTAYPDMVVTALEESGGIGGGPLPKDIWVLDIADGVNLPVVQQPADASFFVTGVPDKAMIRSRPAWSPDGTWLAWTEALYPEWNIQLTLYNFLTADVRTIVTGLPEQGGVPDVLDVMWTDTGLVLHSATYEPRLATWQTSFLVYDAAGTLLREIPLAADTERFTVFYALVQVAGRDMVGVHYNTGDWEVIDLETGLIHPAPAPELYSASAPDTGLAVRIKGGGDTTNQVWLADAAGSALTEPINMGYANFDYIALSPDGGAAAYTPFNPDTRVFEQAVTIWRAGVVTTITLPDGLFLSGFTWGQPTWRITNLEAGQTPSGFSCPGALPPVLAVGGQGQVIPGGGPNNLRAAPSTSGTRLGEIPENGIFTVTGGPVCDGGLVWWQVDYAGQSGWTAESQGDIYYLQPVNGS